MKNKGNEIKDKVKKYIKENPVALFSTICVLFEIVCSCVFIERTSFVSFTIMMLTTSISLELHEKLLPENKNNWF
jgi:hypothetical protein